MPKSELSFFFSTAVIELLISSLLLLKMAINIAVMDVIKVINIPLTMLMSHQSLRLFQGSDVSFFSLLLQH